MTIDTTCHTAKTARQGVVVGVVDSPSARRALLTAFNAASAMGDDLIVLTFYDRYGTAFGESTRARRQALLEQGRVVAEELGMARWRLPVFSDAVEGDAVEHLRKIARRTKLLVLGCGADPKQSPSPLASRCMSIAPCPVVIA